MKQFSLLAPAFFAVAGLCSAATCMNGTLASYEMPGFSCTIGTNTLSGFQSLAGTAGGTELLPSAITIMPEGGSSNPGLMASFSQTATTATGLLEALFTYRLSGNLYSFSSSTLGGASETVDGGVSFGQNICSGGVFGPDGVSGCTGSAGSLAITDGFFGNADSTAFGEGGPISVTDDITLDPGSMGSASGGNITDSFTAVPEPLSVVLTGLGLALAAAAKRRSSGASFFGR